MPLMCIFALVVHANYKLLLIVSVHPLQLGSQQLRPCFIRESFLSCFWLLFIIYTYLTKACFYRCIARPTSSCCNVKDWLFLSLSLYCSPDFSCCASFFKSLKKNSSPRAWDSKKKNLIFFPSSGARMNQKKNEKKI